jgi:hypothetical protein
LAIVELWDFATLDQARIAERMIHDELSEFRAQGEWFEIDPAVAAGRLREIFRLIEKYPHAADPPARSGWKGLLQSGRADYRGRVI